MSSFHVSFFFLLVFAFRFVSVSLLLVLFLFILFGLSPFPSCVNCIAKGSCFLGVWVLGVERCLRRLSSRLVAGEATPVTFRELSFGGREFSWITQVYCFCIVFGDPRGRHYAFFALLLFGDFGGVGAVLVWQQCLGHFRPCFPIRSGTAAQQSGMQILWGCGEVYYRRRTTKRIMLWRCDM